MSLDRFLKDEEGRFLFLRQTQDAATLTIPLPSRVHVDTFKVHLVFTNSNVLLKRRSQLRLKLNGGIFAQASLDPDFPDGIMDAVVPASLVHPGDNQMTIEVAQHYKGDCEDPGSPELWTTVDMKASRIEVSGWLKPVPLSLNALDNLLLIPDWMPYRPVFQAMGTSPEHVQAGALITQALALRSRRQPVLPRVWLPKQGLPPADADVVRFGLFEEMPDVLDALSPQDRERIAQGAGIILLRARANAPDHFELILGAATGKKLVQLAEAFAWHKVPVAQGDRILVDEVVSEQVSAYNAPHAVREGEVYRFADLGAPTATIRGLKGSTFLDVWVPPGLFAESHMDVELKLHFSYGAGLRSDSVMNIYHNGRFVRGISLADIRGLSIRDYRVRIPMALFRPGRNVFEFEARMSAQTGSNCQTGDTKNLLVTLFGDSTIEFPKAYHFAEMPDIGLTTATGFPYPDDHGGSSIVIDQLSPRRLSAAWSMAGRMAQLRHYPLTRIKVRVGKSDDPNILRLAVLGEVEPELWHAAPVDLSDRGTVNHPSLANPAALGAPALNWWEKLKLIFAVDVFHADKRALVDQAKVRQTYNLMNTAVWEQFEHPGYPKGTYSLIVADTERTLASSIEHLVTMWDSLEDIHGDVLVWGKLGRNAAGQPFWVARAGGRSYHVGDISYLERLSYFAIRNPVFLMVVLVSLFVVLAWLTRVLILAYCRKNHPDVRI